MANKELKSITFEGLDDTYTLLTEGEVNTKLSEYAKTSELDKKLDKGNFSITENNITSPANGKIVAQQTTRLLILSGGNSGNTDDFLDLSKYDSSGTFPESISTWGQEYTNEQLRAMFQTAKVDFIPAPYNDWEFVSLTENTDNLVGQYRRAGNTSEVANLTYYLSNASSENANKFKSDYAYLTFNFYSTDVELSERKIWDIVNPDLVVSASSTNAVSGKAVFNALANKADQSAFGNFTFDTDTLKNTNSDAKITLGSDGSQYIPDDLEITKNGISRTHLGDGRETNNWSITGGGEISPRMEVGSKSETLENIIDAPSKIANKQDTLVSGTNIKTINGESVLGSGDISITTPIDNTLSDTSTNAVQNKVVKAAIDGKLSRTTNKQVVYITNSVGVDTTLPYASTATTGSVAVRGEKGVLQVGTPTADNHATTKNYVDNGLVNNIYEANLKWGGKNFTNNFGPLDAALISNLGADRFRGIQSTDGIVIEYSRDGGTTWIDYELSSDSKKQIFSDITPADPIVVGKSTTTTEPTADYKLRITIDCNAVMVYTKIKKFAINVSTSGSTYCTCTIQSSHINDDTNYDITHAENISISGWSGWNIINIPSGYVFGSTNTYSHFRKNIRFIFSIGEHQSSGIGLQLLNIKAFGGMGWAAPSREATYGKPFQYDGTKYNADRLFNFVAGAQINNKEISTKEYVNTNLADKLNKNSTAPQIVYVNDGNSNPSFIKYTPEATPYSIAYRGANGILKVGAPAANDDATTKEYVDNAITATDISEIAKDYTVLNSKNWNTTYANTGDIGEFGVPDYTSSEYPIIYNQPVNEEAIKLAKIINTDTNAIIATFTSKEELGTSNAATAYHFGNNYTLLVIHPQDGDYKIMMDGAIPYSSWTYNYCIGVYLTGAITNTPGEFWMANNIPTTANLTISFPTPLVAPKGYKTLLDSSYFTRYKYTIYDDGRKECEILACAEDISINSSWGILYEGSLGSYSFKSGFFTTAPEMSAEIINTQQIENGSVGSVACLMETGFNPTTTSTGVLYAVRPNNVIVPSDNRKRRIYFKIHAKQV